LSLSGSCEQITIGVRPSSLRIPEIDRTPALGFRALLTVNNVQRVQLHRA
jgi:hypothetical protein